MFQVSKAAHTDTAKIEEHYQMWREVYCDLKKVKLEASLNNPHALELFQSKLPASSREQYINLKISPAMEDKPLSIIMDEFMNTERIRQSHLMRLETLSSGGKKEQKEPKSSSVKSGWTGHKTKDCWSKKTSQSSKVNHQQGGSSNLSSTAADKCPVCSSIHKYTNAGSKHVSRRLGNCTEFLNLSINERAEKIKQLKGCVICLKFTSKHQKDTCLQKDRWKC